MKINYTRDQKAVYGEIVTKDCYRMNRWENNFFDNIVDIGSSLGTFTLYAHMRHPRAKIFAYEPCKMAFDFAVKDSCYFKNIIHINEALGDGEDLFLYKTDWFTHTLFYKNGENDIFSMDSNTYPIKSRSLHQIFELNKINKNDKNYIKIDCEGGERFLINDEKSIDIINNFCCGCSIEVHFPPVRETAKYYERFKSFPKWEIYNEWIYSEFGKNHNIEYVFSSKYRGAGTYNLLKKEYGEKNV